MGLHDPFGYLKHKLWSKERSRVKLAVWLLTTKSQELTWFPHVQVACNIPLENSQLGLQLCFRPHCNQRSTREVMRPQRRESPSCGNFGTPIWMWPPWRAIENTIWGKVVASPKSRSWWVLWVQGSPWLILAPKVFKLCTNQRVVWFVQIRMSE
jgi:hypothetical protein